MSDLTYRLRDSDWQWVPEGAALRVSGFFREAVYLADTTHHDYIEDHEVDAITTSSRVRGKWPLEKVALNLTRPTGICAAVEVVRGRTGDDTWHLRPDLKGSVVMESLDEDGVGCAMIDASGEWVEGKGEAACALAALKATEGGEDG